MKWLAFILAVGAAYPVGVWLRRRPALQPRAWTLLGLLPFLPTLDMALVSYAGRPGDTKGFEVALVDWVALALLFAQTGRPRRLPYRLALLGYLLVAVAAAAQSDWPLGAFGYVWKLCRMYFVFWVLTRERHDARIPAALLRGMMIGLVGEATLTAWQHFGQGMARATGSFAHGNTLGLLVNLVAMAPIALVFAGRARVLTVLAPVAAVCAALLTVSRGALLFFALGAALVYVASSLRAYGPRKAVIGFVGLAIALAGAPLALRVLSARTQAAQESSMELRREYERAASLMVEDHPLGVGPNHFTIMLLARGYGDRSGVDWSQRRAIVHNVYWLTAAEMGWAGVLALAVLFLAPLVTAARDGLRARGDRRGDVLVGLGAGLAVFYVHGFFEWTWRMTQVSYVYWMVVAMVAILSRQLRRERARRPAAASGHRALEASRRAVVARAPAAARRREPRRGRAMPA